MSGKMESQNSYSSFKSESEVSHSVTTTTAYPETTYTRQIIENSFFSIFEKLQHEKFRLIRIRVPQAKNGFQRTMIVVYLLRVFIECIFIEYSIFDFFNIGLGNAYKYF